MMTNTEFRKRLSTHFNISEIKSLCFDLGINFENLPSETLDDLSRELIQYCERFGLKSKLVQRCSELRPNITWNVEDFTGESSNRLIAETLKEHPPQRINAQDGSMIVNPTQNINNMSSNKNESLFGTGKTSLPPKSYHELIGRSHEKQQLLQIFRQSKNTKIVAVVGLGGMGKTALAREVSEICYSENLFDYIVWTSAKVEYFIGEQIVTPKDVNYSFDVLLSEIGRQTDRLDIASMPFEEKRKAVASELASKKLLLVMDNLETVANHELLVQDIHEIIGQSTLLITSRHQINNERAFTVYLTGLTEEEGVSFLKAEGQWRNISSVTQASLNTLIQIYNDTGGAPLAMKLIVGQLSCQPMTLVLDSLKNVSNSGQDYDFYHFVYWNSWRMLSKDSRMVLVDMSVFPPIVGGAVDDVEAVSQVKTEKFWPAMVQLVTMSLVDKTGAAGNERFALHPLTHYFILANITKEWEANG